MGAPGATGNLHLGGDKFGGAGGLLVALNLTNAIDGASHNILPLAGMIQELVQANLLAIHPTGNVKTAYPHTRGKGKNYEQCFYFASNNIEYKLALEHIGTMPYQAGAGLGAGNKSSFSLELVKNPRSSAPQVLRRWAIPYEGVSLLFTPNAIPAVQIIPA